MAQKNKRSKDKEASWEDIGKTIGKKFEDKFKNFKCTPWQKPFVVYKDDNGGFAGRVLFIIGLLYALKYAGVLTSAIPTWTLVMVGIGFALMRL